ncbi:MULTISPECIES: M48 family metalloprotease [unclassified Azospirillum]|uniref:M48 family metalloprotease n=1 Tax=unclassified Azospirillum TaxID=2630922 RepID=UPI000B7707B3|nr:MULTISPECIES: M48 family metalloprotease [unclassified Azospirillum]
MFAIPKRIARTAVALLISATLIVQPAMAQQSISFIRDTEIEHILRDYATPIFNAAGVVPEAVTIGLVRADSLNAFVAGGQNMFFHTGFLMDTTLPELIGVTAHETGHIAGGHLARSSDAMSDAATIATIFTLLGLAAALGAGRSDIGMGVLGGGQEAAMRTFFAFTRAQEGSADAAATVYLEKNGWSSEGLLAMMQKLAGQELLPENRQVEFVRTHPLTQNRIQAIRYFVETQSKNNGKRFPEEFYDKHERMVAKLMGFLRPDQALRHYDAKDNALPARYGRAIALYQKGRTSEALNLTDGLIAQEKNNAYFYELKGQILFEDGRPADAVIPYRESVRLDPESGLLRASLGHALLEVGDDRFLDEAIGHLNAAARQEPGSALVWRLLSSAYSRADRQPQLAYARAEEALARGDIRAAKFHADRAERLLPAGSPEWIRAQDIRVMVESRAGMTN